MAAADLLAEVEAAISKCLQSQAYEYGGRKQQQAALRDLMQARKDLLQEVSESENSGQMCSLGQINRPI